MSSPPSPQGLTPTCALVDNVGLSWLAPTELSTTDVFTTVGESTYSKNGAEATIAIPQSIAGGGGGGAGSIKNGATGGGQAGAGGNLIVVPPFDPSLISDTVTVAIGAGGTGAPTTATTFGETGGTTSFGSYVTSNGGAGGESDASSDEYSSGGTGTSTLPGYTSYTGGDGGVGSSGFTSPPNAPNTALAPTGGGGGGAQTSIGAPENGGSGGEITGSPLLGGAGGVSQNNLPGLPGGNGLSPSIPGPGTGGGGGGSSITDESGPLTVGDGGNGGLYGAGGGGGGCGLGEPGVTGVGGAGGNGAQGYLVVTSTYNLPSSYNVYRNGTLIGNTTSLTFTDTTAPASETGITYAITAVYGSVESPSVSIVVSVIALQPFNVMMTVISQYANSPVLLQLVNNLETYLDPTTNFSVFYSYVWNVATAVGFGLDTWGHIVNVARTLNVQGTVVMLDDDNYRTLVLTKALANIIATVAPAFNQLLSNLFPGQRCYVGDLGNMSMTVVFEFILTPTQYAIMTQSGVFPHPAGVQYNIIDVNPAGTFGFKGSGLQPFNQGTFYR